MVASLAEAVQVQRAEEQSAREGGHGSVEVLCARCRAPLRWPRPGKPGRKPLYCSPTCRARASESRRRA